MVLAECPFCATTGMGLEVLLHPSELTQHEYCKDNARGGKAWWLKVKQPPPEGDGAFIGTQKLPDWNRAAPRIVKPPFSELAASRSGARRLAPGVILPTLERRELACALQHEGFTRHPKADFLSCSFFFFFNFTIVIVAIHSLYKCLILLSISLRF